MIFASVGTQLPFPRLLRALEGIAARHGLDIFAQSADPDYRSTAIRSRPHLTPAEYDRHVGQAAVLVGHAGTGTVLTAKAAGKPLIVFPRRAALGEHRNDHQVATARFLQGMTGVHVAWDEAALEALIVDRALAPADESGGATRTMLIDALRGFIDAA